MIAVEASNKFDVTYKSLDTIPECDGHTDIAERDGKKIKKAATEYVTDRQYGGHH